MKKGLLIVLVIFFSSCNKDLQSVKITGPVFGTSFGIHYYAYNGQSFAKEIDSLFSVINNSMSNYIPTSDISRLNRDQSVLIEHHFKTVFKSAKQIYTETEGVFDPTIGKVVNAWNFGSTKNTAQPNKAQIDSLMHFVGFNKVNIIEDKIDMPKGVFIDFNAIAKGYGVDVISDFLESKNITNYLVDIGGELRANGTNLNKQKGWTVGLENPNFDGSQSYSKVMVLDNQAMATSGTYRKFKLDAQGNRYAHIIDAKTGYSSKSNILSVSVIAQNCMLADGYATAFQAMGVSKTALFLEQHPELKVYLIYQNATKQLATKSFNGFPVD